MGDSQNIQDSADDIASLLMPRLNCHDYLYSAEYGREIDVLCQAGVGGFVLFEGSLQECRLTCQKVRRSSPHRLILAADCEFGTAMRFSGGTEFPPMMALANAGDTDLVKTVAHAIAREMSLVGLDWNLAPVLDVTSNPRNPIVNVRSFSERAEEVATFGAAYIEGTRKGGVLSSGKHAPGHGDTETDSHLSLPFVNSSLETLVKRDLLPFRAAVDAGVSSIMTGHLAVYALSDDFEPVSLSRSAVGRLRELIGFDGVMITDALDMGSLMKPGVGGNEVEPAVRALIAGNDILEVPADPGRALERLRAALLTGQVSRERVSEACSRRSALLEEIDRIREGKDPIDDLEVILALNGEIAAQAFDQSWRTTGQELPHVDQTGDWYIFFGPADHDRANSITRSLEDWVQWVHGGSALETGERIRAGDKSLPTVVLFVFSPRGRAGRVVLEGAESTRLTEVAGDDAIFVTLGNPYIEQDRPHAARVDLFSSAPEVLKVLRRLFTRR